MEPPDQPTNTPTLSGPNVTSNTSRRIRVLTVAAACSALFVIFLDNTVVNVALPTIQRHLATSTDELEWAVNVYVVTFASLVVLAGAIGDALGRRRLFIAGLLMFGAASALAPVTASPVQ